MKCVVIDGSIVNGLKQPFLFSFLLDKPTGYEVFCVPETIHYEKVNKSALQTIPFCLENNENENNFNGEKLTYTIQMIKISTIKGTFKNLKVVLTV